MGHNTHSSILHHKVLLMLGKFMAARMTDEDVDNCNYIQWLYHRHHRHHHHHHHHQCIAAAATRRRRRQQWVVAVSDVYCSLHFLNCRWSDPPALQYNRLWVTRDQGKLRLCREEVALTRWCQDSFTLYSEMLVIIAAVPPNRSVVQPTDWAERATPKKDYQRTILSDHNRHPPGRAVRLVERKVMVRYCGTRWLAANGVRW